MTDLARECDALRAALDYEREMRSLRDCVAGARATVLELELARVTRERDAARAEFDAFNAACGVARGSAVALLEERDYYRARSAEMHRRAQWAEAQVERAMRAGLEACAELRADLDDARRAPRTVTHTPNQAELAGYQAEIARLKRELDALRSRRHAELRSAQSGHRAEQRMRSAVERELAQVLAERDAARTWALRWKAGAKRICLHGWVAYARSDFERVLRRADAADARAERLRGVLEWAAEQASEMARPEFHAGLADALDTDEVNRER